MKKKIICKSKILIVFIFAVQLFSGCNKKKQDDYSFEKSELKQDLIKQNLKKKLTGLNKYSESNLKLVHKYLKNEDPVVRLIVLRRIHSWEANEVIPIYLDTLKNDKYAMVRKKSLELLWKGKNTPDSYSDHWNKVMRGTLEALKDKYLYEKAAEILKKRMTHPFMTLLREIIEKSSDEKLPVLFSVYCSVDFNPSDVKFLIKYNKKLGKSYELCRKKTEEAVKTKYIKSDFQEKQKP